MRKSGSNPNSGENSVPYPHFNTGHMRKEAERQAHTDESHHAKHESDLSKLDRGEGSENGGR